MLDFPRLLRALNVSAERRFGSHVGYATDEEAILAALKLMETRTTHGRALLAVWTSRLDQQLVQLCQRFDLAAIAPDVHAEMQQLRAQIARAAPADKTELDAIETRLLSAWASLAGRLTADRRLSDAARAELMLGIARDEYQRTTERMGATVLSSVPETADITSESLERYLADRFGDPTIKVTEFRPLPGGYGKETTLFAVSGHGLAGNFVMRRDRDRPTVDNDCHRVDREYPVIRAAFERGFPAPDALWCDTEHRLLPGGHFLVMRRAAGAAGGDVFGAAGGVSDDLTRLLATSLGNLHTLPPLRELGALTETIKPELWDLSLKAVTARYIASIRDIYLAEMHEPAPAVLAFYGWLLDNVPDVPGRPVLLHGDIGFHNFLVDDGRLTAVVDWEFAHIGDPAEDIGYVCNTVGNSLDWAKFMEYYRAAGGAEIDPERLRFFRIWGHLRNLTACQLTSNAFEHAGLGDLKLAHVGHSMTPMFLEVITKVLAETGGA